MPEQDSHPFGLGAKEVLGTENGQEHERCEYKLMISGIPIHNALINGKSEFRWREDGTN